MRTLLFLVSLIPSLAHAAAAEDFHYYAIFDNNKIVNIAFAADGQPWNGQRAIYGNANTKAFSYCWESEDSEYFFCSETKSTSNAVAYTRGPTAGATHQAAMQLFKKNIKLSETGGLQEYYVCKTGCSSKVPRFIFNVGDSGC